jgi:2-keto-3-deoxy-L-rhamnonate aldolase RhmA
MSDPRTGFRARLATGAPLYGALLAIPDPAVARILGRSGADFVLIDAEHGSFSLESMLACVEALDATGVSIVVRVAGNDTVHIKQALELGIDAVQVPNVRSAGECAAAIQAARFAPEGTRGIGVGRASGYGADLVEYLSESNSRTAVIAMIEDAEGVANAASIAGVAGLDAIFVGPFDLAASLGAIGDPGHADVRAATASVYAAAAEAGIAVGTVCAPEQAPEQLSRGARLLIVVVDGIALATAARQSVDLARGETSS